MTTTTMGRKGKELSPQFQTIKSTVLNEQKRIDNQSNAFWTSSPDHVTEVWQVV
jgi:hypothetical protein